MVGLKNTSHTIELLKKKKSKLEREEKEQCQSGYGTRREIRQHENNISKIGEHFGKTYSEILDIF